MKVYSKKDGTYTEHHPVDAREIVRERPDEFTLQGPTGSEAPSKESVDADNAKRKADEEAKAAALAADRDRKSAIAVAKRKANKLRDEAEEAQRKAKNAKGVHKGPAEEEAVKAEKAADDADSEVARLESGGELHPEQKVQMS